MMKVLNNTEVQWDSAVLASRRAASKLNREACGYLLRDGTMAVCANVAEQPGRFMFDKASTDEALDAWLDGRLVGIWHSHPNGDPTPSDEDWAGHPHGPSMIILALHEDSFSITVWDEDDRP